MDTRIETEGRVGRICYAPTRLGRLNLGMNKEMPKTENNSACPFCPGNEGKTPPEIWAYNPEGWFFRTPDIPGWEVRIIPNKFCLPGTLDSEVVIFSPEHQARMSALPVEQLGKIFYGIQERFRSHEESGKIPLFFINEGNEAGCSLEHPHGQLVTFGQEELSPDKVEIPQPEQIIFENDNFVLHCPTESEFPLEMALRPKEFMGSFTSFPYERMGELARAFKAASLTLENTPLAQGLANKTWRREDGRVPYNVYLKNCTYNGWRSWHLRFMPCLTIEAGFEKATGWKINIVPPSTAANLLRETLASAREMV